MIWCHLINILPDLVEFPYTKSQSNNYLPTLPIIFSHEDKIFSVGHALVDTGSDLTILPLEIAHYLQVELDDSQQFIVDGAGGGRFKVMPSREKIGYTITGKGYRPITWKGTVYFTETEPMILLGHHQCLEKFDLTFCGPRRLLQIIPRF